MHERAITTDGPHGLPAGSRITMELPDRRWWRRLLFWLLRRGTPMRKQTFTVLCGFDDVPANRLQLLGPYKAKGADNPTPRT